MLLCLLFKGLDRGGQKKLQSFQTLSLEMTKFYKTLHGFKIFIREQLGDEIAEFIPILSGPDRIGIAMTVTQVPLIT